MNTSAEPDGGLFPTAPNDPVIPTAAEIEAARTPAGGWTKAQLAAWGVPWPPPKGWRQDLAARAAAEHEQR